MDVTIHQPSLELERLDLLSEPREGDILACQPAGYQLCDPPSHSLNVWIICDAGIGVQGGILSGGPIP
jgi:hypothetical protein